MDGPKNFRNEAFYLVKEFFDRKVLAEIGINGPSTAEIPYRKAAYFLEINNEVEKARNDKLKKRKR